MSSPYRTPALKRPSRYGVWEDRKQRSLAVKLGFSSQRWGLRTQKLTVPLHFREQVFEDIHAACVALEREREFNDGDPTFYLVDRKTGKCFSPPPLILGRIVAKQCLICKAGPEERCDAGLHS